MYASRNPSALAIKVLESFTKPSIWIRIRTFYISRRICRKWTHWYQIMVANSTTKQEIYTLCTAFQHSYGTTIVHVQIESCSLSTPNINSLILKPSHKFWYVEVTYSKYESHNIQWTLFCVLSFVMWPNQFWIIIHAVVFLQLFVTYLGRCSVDNPSKVLNDSANNILVACILSVSCPAFNKRTS